MKTVDIIRTYVEESAKKVNKSWFIDYHVKFVAKNAQYLIEKLPNANKEVVMLSAWLHDIQRIECPDMDHLHEETSTKLAEEIMLIYNIDSSIIEKVKECIFCHRCKERKPETIEAKILATADAMSQFSSDFFLSLILYGTKSKSDIENFKEWSLKKITRNINRETEGGKIYFDFAKEKVKPDFEKLKAFFEMN